MLKALKQSEIARKNKEIPIGAIIVKNNVILAKTYNKVENNRDPTSHAEILAIQKACKKIGSKYLDGCDIYVTLEPCHMCIAAISLSKIDRVFFAINDAKFGGLFSSDNNFLHLSQNCYKKPEIYNNIMQVQSLNMMQNFFQELRHN